MKTTSTLLFISMAICSLATAGEHKLEPVVIERVEPTVLVTEAGERIPVTEDTVVESRGFSFSLADVRPGWAVIPRFDSCCTDPSAPAHTLQVVGIPRVRKFAPYLGPKMSIAVARAEIGLLPPVEALDGVDVQQAVETNLASTLHASGRFVITDLASRPETRTYIDIQESGNSLVSSVKPGNVIAPRYMIKASILDFEHAVRQGKGKAFGVSAGKQKVRARLAMQLRLVSVESGDVLTVVIAEREYRTDRLQVGVNVAEIAAALATISPTKYNRDLELVASAGLHVASERFAYTPFAQLLALVVNDLVEKLIASLPDKIGQTVVVQITEQSTLVLRGGRDAGIVPGTRFRVYPGETDGSVSGYPEGAIASLEVVEVHPKFSIARLVNGSGIRRGDLCIRVDRHEYE